MISGLRRGLALATILALGFGISSQAGDKNVVIPEVVDAIDLNTGAPYYAPPVPQGHYTKDTYGKIAGAVHGALGSAKGLVKSLCSLCGGSGQCVGCGNAAGTTGLGTCGGCAGSGYTTSNAGDAHAGHNHGAAGVPVIAANGAGSGHGLLSGLHGNGAGAAAGHATFGGGAAPAAPAPVSYSGAYGGHGKASAQAAPSAQGGASPQSACANGGCGGSACGDPACHGLFGRKGGRGGAGGAGNGCGTPGCTNPGCGLGGLFAGHGNGNGNGAGFGHGGGAGCGNPGCTSCGNNGNGAGHPGLGAGHSGLGSKLAGLFHKGPKYKWFMGPGGPVPLTPGYVPYVNPVRSPRDFFAFPPYLDQAMEPGYASMPKSTAGFATDRATTPTDFVAPAAKPVVPPPAPRTGTVPPPAPAADGGEKQDK